MDMDDQKTAADSVFHYWNILTKDLNEEIRQEWWNKITKHYAEPLRSYHNMIHISKMFEHYETMKSKLVNLQAFQYAIIFHDLVYDPKSADNEEDSILIFEKFSEDAGIEKDSEIYKNVEELIRLTKTHSTEEHKTNGAYGQDDKHYFLDTDMSILGVSWTEYDIYAKQIKDEYSFLPDATYKMLRAKILKSFLLIPNIFSTKIFRDLYEKQARDNIEQEIFQLQS